MKKLFSYLIIATIFQSTSLMAQGYDLEAMLEDEMEETTEYILGTFLSTYVLSNHSTEMLDKNGLNFRMSHKFGYLNSGAEHAFGFDQANVFTELEYAPFSWLNMGIARAHSVPAINGHAKFKILRQSEGKTKMPLSLVLLTEADYKTGSLFPPQLDEDKTGRLTYSTQLLLAHKFKKRLALQVMPTYVHRNLVKTPDDRNDVLAMGTGVSYKVLPRLRINSEYFIVQNLDKTKMDYSNRLALGVSYQTSRHTFEVFATNSSGIGIGDHITTAPGKIAEGDIAIGFNASVIFTTKK